MNTNTNNHDRATAIIAYWAILKRLTEIIHDRQDWLSYVVDKFHGHGTIYAQAERDLIDAEDALGAFVTMRSVPACKSASGSYTYPAESMQGRQHTDVSMLADGSAYVAIMRGDFSAMMYVRIEMDGFTLQDCIFAE